MEDTPTVARWMRPEAKTFRQDDDMRKAVNYLAKSSSAAIPVLDARGRVVGLLSEKDALRAIGRWTYEQVAGGVVADEMSPLSVQLSPQMDLLTALRAFLECNFSCLPVIDGERLVGRLTRNDLLRGLVAWATAIDRDLQKRVTSQPENLRPSTIESMQRVAASVTPEQLAQIFRRGH